MFCQMLADMVSISISSYGI